MMGVVNVFGGMAKILHARDWLNTSLLQILDTPLINFYMQEAREPLQNEFSMLIKYHNNDSSDPPLVINALSTIFAQILQYNYVANTNYSS